MDYKTGNELLPVPYFHVVLRLEVLNKTALHEPKMLYDILFETGLGNASNVWQKQNLKWE